MNLKQKLSTAPRTGAIVGGPTNLTDPKNFDASEENKEKFVNDWALFSQTILWVAQNTTDRNAARACMEALQNSELIDLPKKDA